MHRAFELQPASLLQLITRADALRKPERFGQFLDACLADWRGRSGRAGDEYPQAPFLLNLAAQLHALDVSRLRQQGFEGEALAREIRQARIELIAQQQALAQD